MSTHCLPPVYSYPLPIDTSSPIPPPVHLALVILRSHLPYSVPLYRRLQVALCRTERAVLLSTLPLDGEQPFENLHFVSRAPPIFTMIHCDLGRRDESQAWIYNSIENPKLFPCLHASPFNRDTFLGSHTHLALEAKRQLLAVFNHVSLIRDQSTDDESSVYVASVHHMIRTLLHTRNISKGDTGEWAKFISSPTWDVTPHSMALPPGYEFSKATEADLTLAIATTDIRRSIDTIRHWPNVTVVYGEERKTVAWVLMNTDGSVSSAYVLPEHRRKHILIPLTLRLGMSFLESGNVFHQPKIQYHIPCGFEHPLAEHAFGGFSSQTRDSWVHAETLYTNMPIHATSAKLGSKLLWTCYWVWVDLENLPKSHVLLQEDVAVGRTVRAHL